VGLYALAVRLSKLSSTPLCRPRHFSEFPHLTPLCSSCQHTEARTTLASLKALLLGLQSPINYIPGTPPPPPLPHLNEGATPKLLLLLSLCAAGLATIAACPAAGEHCTQAAYAFSSASAMNWQAILCVDHL
jgi:hypothetical protein